MHERRRAVRDNILVALGPVFSAPLACAATWLELYRGVADYGWISFLGVPFGIGLICSLFAAAGGITKFWTKVGLSFAGLVLYGLIMLGGRFEGLICIVLAAPIEVPALALGCWAGGGISDTYESKFPPPPAIGATLLFAAFGVWDELVCRDRSVQEDCVTSVEIQADQSKVWKAIVELDRLPPDRSWMAALGLACPEGTHLQGRGVGSTRQCTLSTGTMNERITRWEPGRRLGFIALNSPPPMREFNPFGEVRAPHLSEHYYKVVYAEFRLEPLQGGRTRLSRLTRYEHRIRPALYWSFWCNFAGDQAHRRVLDAIKQVAQSDPRFAANLSGRLARSPG